LTPINRGGFGMVDLWEVVSALRLRRHLYLLNNNIHPLSELLRKLTEENDYLSLKPAVDIDVIVGSNLSVLHKKGYRNVLRQPGN
jgi:hypothetical protein